MEEHDLKTTYRIDLEAKLFICRHDIVKCIAEISVINNRIPEIEQLCDQIAAQIRQLDESEMSEQYRQDLIRKLSEKMAFKKYLSDCREEAHKRLGAAQMRQHELEWHIKHFDQAHSQ